MGTRIAMNLMRGPVEKDYWTDPDADEIAVLVARIAAKSFETCDPGTITKTAYQLPGLSLEVTGYDAETTRLLTGVFSHLEISGEKDAALSWTIIRLAPGNEFSLPPAPMPLGRYGTLHRNPDNSVFVERRNGFTTVFWLDRWELVTVCHDLNAIDNDALAKPMLRILIGLLHKKGVVVAHAALLGGREYGMLITGKGGAGKSTISAAALDGGLSFAGDDFIAIEQREDGFYGHSLYGSVLLDATSSPAAQPLRRTLRPAHSGFKAMIDVGQNFRPQLQRTLKIDAIAVPEISAEPNSRLALRSRGAIARALMPTSIFASPWREPSRAATLFDMVANLPAYTYFSGAEFRSIAAPLRERYGQ